MEWAVFLSFIVRFCRCRSTFKPLSPVFGLSLFPTGFVRFVMISSDRKIWFDFRVHRLLAGLGEVIGTG